LLEFWDGLYFGAGFAVAMYVIGLIVFGIIAGLGLLTRD
jgi:hypothetical protein